MAFPPLDAAGDGTYDPHVPETRTPSRPEGIPRMNPKIRDRRPVVLSILAVLWLAAPMPPAAGQEAARGTARSAAAHPNRGITTVEARGQLRRVLAAADEADLRLTPQAALLRGDLRFAGDFGDTVSDAWYRRLEATLREQVRQIRRVDRAALEATDRIAYDVFRYQAEFALRAFDNGVAPIQQRLPIDHVFGQHVTFQQLSSGGGAAPYRTIADYTNGLRRIDGFVRYVDRSIVTMRRGIRSGHVHPRIVPEKIIGQLESALAEPADASAYLLPVKNMPASIPATEGRRLEAAYRQALTAKIRPALARLLVFMQKEYLPASRPDPAGLAAMPDGARLYAHLLEQHTTTQLGPEEIHSLGLAEVARIRADMDAIRVRVGFEGDLPGFFGFLRSDPRFRYRTPEELLAGYRRLHSRVDEVLPKFFRVAAKSRLEIRPVPPEQEGSAGGAYYMIGTPDGSRPGVFFVNTSDLPTRTTPRMAAIFLHEGVPGHHLQGSLAQENAGLPALLRFNWNTGYGEGWALYSEWLGTEMGLYQDPYDQFGRLDMEMIRAVRLVVDTGLHARGWSREAAIAYMLEFSSLDRAAVEQEVDRYIVWPGQATAYKVGELFIRRLRARAEDRLGARFDIREFHQQVLETGSIPLAVLEQKIDAWIARSLR